MELTEYFQSLETYRKHYYQRNYTHCRYNVARCGEALQYSVEICACFIKEHHERLALGKESKHSYSQHKYCVNYTFGNHGAYSFHKRSTFVMTKCAASGDFAYSRHHKTCRIGYKNSKRAGSTPWFFASRLKCETPSEPSQHLRHYSEKQ